jgi:Zn-dependent protease/CBS domain-containing protein
MSWSLKIARIAGVKVYLHFTFILLLLLVVLAEGGSAPSVSQALFGILFFVSLFACVLAHEFGHILMARKFGVGTRDVTLLPIGGVARLEKLPDMPRHELWIALAGPMVNLLIVILLAFWILFLGEGPRALRPTLEEAGFARNLMTINMIMILFNMLPAFPMDGGRVLRAIMAQRTDFVRATRLAARLGRGMAVLFVLAGIFWLKNPFLFFIALVVWFGAGQEAEHARMKGRLMGATVGQAMLTDFHALRSEDLLTKVIDRVLAGNQIGFPVVDASGGVVGILDSGRLLEALKHEGANVSVESVMRVEFATLEPSSLLEPVWEKYQRGPDTILPVVENGVLMGILTMENVMELLRVRHALNPYMRANPTG